MNPADRLDLSRAGLHHFPPEACCLNVRVIGMSHNQLTSLPREIAGMTHLEELHLAHNPWREFPYEIEALPNLRSAHFGRNQDMFHFRGYPRELRPQNSSLPLRFHDEYGALVYHS